MHMQSKKLNFSVIVLTFGSKIQDFINLSRFISGNFGGNCARLRLEAMNVKS